MSDDVLSLDLFGEEDGEEPVGWEDDARGGTPVRDQGFGGDVAESAGSGGEVPERGSEAGDEVEVWTVSQVNKAVRALLERTLPPLWVSGEVGSWKRARSGHRYFTLKDDRAQLRCVMWRNDAAKLPTDPDEGMEVRAFGTLTLYEVRGEYQLVVRRLEAAGEEGLWRLAFAKLRRKLEGEGLLEEERKRPLPRFPSSVGVVTSATGAAVRDILTVIRRRAPWTRVVVRSTRVQGEGASEEVAEAVRALAGSGLVEVLIVGRGGGSVEDLWAFNEEPVARAIAAAPVPVISAVGHEVDVTIADLVADARAPTPSAAAEAAVRDGRALLESLKTISPRMTRALRASVERRARAVEEAGRRVLRAWDGLVEPRRTAVERLVERLEWAVERVLEERGRRLTALATTLEALSPLSTMRRGYAVPLGEDGRVLRTVDEFEPGAGFTLRVVDGRVTCEAKERQREEEVLGERS